MCAETSEDKQSKNSVKPASQKKLKNFKKVNIPPFSHPLLHTTLKVHNNKIIL